MQLLFLDDAAQRTPSRERVGPLVAVGEITVDAKVARELDYEIDCICIDGSASQQMNPSSGRQTKTTGCATISLVKSGRSFTRVLGAAAKCGAIGIVTVQFNQKHGDRKCPHTRT